jgi:hypothetical protein
LSIRQRWSDHMSQATHNEDGDGRWRRLWEVADMVALWEAVEPHPLRWFPPPQGQREHTTDIRMNTLVWSHAHRLNCHTRRGVGHSLMPLVSGCLLEHKKTFRNDRHEAGRRVTGAIAAHGRHWTKPAG